MALLETTTIERRKSETKKASWRDFQHGAWCDSIDVRDFIVKNVTPYDGDESFLVGSTARTKAVWDKLQPYFGRILAKQGVRVTDWITVTP